MTHLLQLLLVLALIVAAAKLSAAAANRIGQPARQIDQGIHPLPYSMLVPVFFISIGLLANGRALGDQVLFTGLLVVVAIVTKAAGCGIFARLSGFTTAESVRVGAG